MTSLLQHTLHAHSRGVLFISGPLIIFGFWGWKASCSVSVPLLNRKGLFEDVFQHPAANMGSHGVVAEWGPSESIVMI